MNRPGRFGKWAPRRWGIALLASGLSAAIVASLLWWRAGFVPPPLPDPNGFDDLVRAGRGIRGQVPDVSSAGEQELRGFVEANGEALAAARLGLTRECRVPLGDSRSALQDHMDQASSVRNVARLLIAAGMLADQDGRTDEALRCFLDAVRLGVEAFHGGFLIDSQMGLACERMGRLGLEGLRAQLSAGQCRDLIRVLGRVDGDRETIPSVIAREKDWFRATAGWQEWTAVTLNPVVIGKLTAPAYAAAEAGYRREQARSRLLVADLAIRCFRLENGHDPESLSELVPRYLPSVPEDPFRGGPLIYRPQSKGYQLYSVGPDRKDDGGTPVPEKSNPASAKGDYLADPESKKYYNIGK